ncbi:MAG: GEVED domain-containing protein [Solirubrobacterales bacterium]
MTQRAFSVPCVAVLVLIVMMQTSAYGQANDHETPSEFPGVWYKIVLDGDGNYIDGEGDGSGWYHYPQSDAWRMWFYNGAYDEERKGYLTFHVYAKAVDKTKSSSVVANFGWTTAAWSKLNRGRPPQPDDMPTTSEEGTYMSTSRVYSVEGAIPGTAETIHSYTIDDYNPEWICIEIKARNAYIYRGAFHECQADGSQTGACCNHQTGYCYVTTEEDCTSPFEWLGVGTTCAQCTRTGTGGTDFGDAPDGYQTVSRSDGARHSIVSGVYLGGSVDAESDGQPNTSATGDDLTGGDEDGVVFTSALHTGQDATLEVTASTDGYLNAWIDFDSDGLFDAESDAIFIDQVLTRGVNQLSFAVPAYAASGWTFARFRFNTRGLLNSYGAADDGEVEDYRVQIVTSYDSQSVSGAARLAWSQSPTVSADSKEANTFEAGGVSSSLHLHTVAADDWEPVEGEPITGIHWWGTFNGWTESYLPSDMPLAFHIGIWTDVPDPQRYDLETFAHPGTLIWETYCTNWSWAVAGREVSTDGGAGRTCFLFSRLLSQDQWFEIGRASESKVYWLSIAALYDPTEGGPQHEWNWKLRTTATNSGGASISTIVPVSEDSWPPSLGVQWETGTAIRDRRFSPLDMAFQLTTFVPLESEDRTSSLQNPTVIRDKGELAMLAENWLTGVQ